MTEDHLSMDHKYDPLYDHNLMKSEFYIQLNAIISFCSPYTFSLKNL